jgi:hypothetical protein
VHVVEINFIILWEFVYTFQEDLPCKTSEVYYKGVFEVVCVVEIDDLENT